MKESHSTNLLEDLARLIDLKLRGDGIGMFDYANAIGQVTKADYKPLYSPDNGGYFVTNLVHKLMDRATGSNVLGPNHILSPNLDLGQCWPFKGEEARVTISFRCPLIVQNVTLDHVLPEVALHTTSAPKKFRVLGSISENPDAAPVLLLDTIFHDKLGTQIFSIKPHEEYFDQVELWIYENYGHWYTCVYRFRVHGKPADTCLKEL